MEISLKPTKDWMQENYEYFNKTLFNGELSYCKLRPFTSGKGSNGRTLGWFKLDNPNVKVQRKDRQMFITDDYGDREYIDSMNFADLCEPVIELNANYTWSEHAMQATLVHEMCHYYTYMNGVCPKQGHGLEFKSIGAIVSKRSNGLFTIQRLASAEQMSEMVLDQEFQDKNNKRFEKRKNNMNVVFVYNSNRTIEMTMTTHQDVVDEIVRLNSKERTYNVVKRGQPEKIVLSNDASLIDMLINKGYNKNMRTYRFWNVESKLWITSLEHYDCKTLVDKTSQQEIPNTNPNLIPIFKLKFTNGNCFELKNTTKEEIRTKLKEKFPNMDEVALNWVINNKKNYPTNENKLNKIIETVVNEYIDNEVFSNTNEDESIAINPNMNLGLVSPLEY